MEYNEFGQPKNYADTLKKAQELGLDAPETIEVNDLSSNYLNQDSLQPYDGSKIDLFEPTLANGRTLFGQAVLNASPINRGLFDQNRPDVKGGYMQAIGDAVLQGNPVLDFLAQPIRDINPQDKLDMSQAPEEGFNPYKWAQENDLLDHIQFFDDTTTPLEAVRIKNYAEKQKDLNAVMSANPTKTTIYSLIGGVPDITNFLLPVIRAKTLLNVAENATLFGVIGAGYADASMDGNASKGTIVEGALLGGVLGGAFSGISHAFSKELRLARELDAVEATVNDIVKAIGDLPNVVNKTPELFPYVDNNLKEYNRESTTYHVQEALGSSDVRVEDPNMFDVSMGEINQYTYPLHHEDTTAGKYVNIQQSGDTIVAIEKPQVVVANVGKVKVKVPYRKVSSAQEMVDLDSTHDFYKVIETKKDPIKLVDKSSKPETGRMVSKDGMIDYTDIRDTANDGTMFSAHSREFGKVEQIASDKKNKKHPIGNGFYLSNSAEHVVQTIRGAKGQAYNKMQYVDIDMKKANIVDADLPINSAMSKTLSMVSGQLVKLSDKLDSVVELINNKSSLKDIYDKIYDLDLPEAEHAQAIDLITKAVRARGYDVISTNIVTESGKDAKLFNVINEELKQAKKHWADDGKIGKYTILQKVAKEKYKSIEEFKDGATC